MRGSLKRKQIFRIVLVVGGLKGLFFILFFRFLAHTPWASHLFPDVWSWLDYVKKCKQGLIPYINLSREYPQLTGYFFWLVSKIFPTNSDPFLHAHAFLMWALDAFDLFLFIQILQYRKVTRIWLGAFLFSFSTVSLLSTPVRFEALIVSFLLLGYLADLRQRRMVASWLWSVGFHVKWITGFLMAVRDARLVLVEKKFRIVIRSWLIFIALTFFILGGSLLADYLVTGNISAALSPYTYHLHRPLYWDTVLGATTLWLGPISWEHWASFFSLALMLTFTVFPIQMSYERKYILVCLAALLCNRVYSPQFQLWFYPFLILLLLQPGYKKIPKTGFGLFVLLDLCTTFIYPFCFPKVLGEIHDFKAFNAAQYGGSWTVFFTTLIYLRAIIVAALMSWLLFVERKRKRNVF